MALWSRDDTIARVPTNCAPALLPSARIVHVDDVDQQAAIQVATPSAQRGDRHERYRSRHDRTDELVAAVSIPILAEHVPAAPTVNRRSDALRMLHERHGTSCAQRSGVAAPMDDGRVHYAPHSADAVDTTGAGDVFRGAFIYGLLRGDAPPALLRFANAAARSAAPAAAR